MKLWILVGILCSVDQPTCHTPTLMLTKTQAECVCEKDLIRELRTYADFPSQWWACVRWDAPESYVYQSRLSTQCDQTIVAYNEHDWIATPEEFAAYCATEDAPADICEDN